MPYSTPSPSPSTLSLSPTFSTTAIISLTDDFEDIHDLPPPMYTSPSYYNYDYSPAILHAPRMRFVPLPVEEDDDVPPPPYDTYYRKEEGLGLEYDYEPVPERQNRTYRGTPVQVRSYHTYTPPSSTSRLPPPLPTPPSPASSTTAIVSLLTPSSSSSSSSSSRRRHINIDTYYTPPSSHSHKSTVQRPRKEKGGLSVIIPTVAPKPKAASKSSKQSSPAPAPSVTSSKASKGYSYGFSWHPVDDLTPPPSPPRKRTKHASNTVSPRSSFSLTSTSSSSSGTFAPCRLYVPLPC